MVIETREAHYGTLSLAGGMVVDYQSGAKDFVGQYPLSA